MRDNANRSDGPRATAGLAAPAGDLDAREADRAAEKARDSRGARGLFGRVWAFLMEPPASTDDHSPTRGWDAEPRIFDGDRW